MSLHERLRQLATALPSDGSVTFTRADLVALLEEEPGRVSAGSARDMTVEEVGAEIGRAPSTIRGYLISKALLGYKLNHRDWRVPRAALREYLEAQATQWSETPGEVDITAWRNVQEVLRPLPLAPPPVHNPCARDR